MINIETIKLLKGSHGDTKITGQGCALNVISYLNGEDQITDKSPCVCVTIRPIMIFLNDFADDVQRQRLVPFLLRAMGSATDDRDVMNMRISSVVKYAEFNARLTAEYAAMYAAEDSKYAKYAAKYAESAAEYASMYAAEYAAMYDAKYDEYAAKYAAKAAMYAAKYAAEYAAEYAKYAAKAAAEDSKSAAKHAAGFDDIQEAIFQAGLDFLNEACPITENINQEIICRANKLMELVS